MNTTKTISIIFYKGQGTLGEKLIRLWTHSPYAHCEFGRSDGLYHSNDRFRFVSRTQELHINPHDWDSCSLTLPSPIVERLERRQLKKNGTAYDWMGILFSQLFRLGMHTQNRWFCSKSNADDLHYAYRLMERCGCEHYRPFIEVLAPIKRYQPHELSPRDLFLLTKEMEYLQKGCFSLSA